MTNCELIKVVIEKKKIKKELAIINKKIKEIRINSQPETPQDVNLDFRPENLTIPSGNPIDFYVKVEGKTPYKETAIFLKKTYTNLHKFYKNWINNPIGRFNYFHYLNKYLINSSPSNNLLDSMDSTRFNDPTKWPKYIDFSKILAGPRFNINNSPPKEEMAENIVNSTGIYQGYKIIPKENLWDTDYNKQPSVWQGLPGYEGKQLIPRETLVMEWAWIDGNSWAMPYQIFRSGSWEYDYETVISKDTGYISGQPNSFYSGLLNYFIPPKESGSKSPLNLDNGLYEYDQISRIIGNIVAQYTEYTYINKTTPNKSQPIHNIGSGFVENPITKEAIPLLFGHGLHPSQLPGSCYMIYIPSSQKYICVMQVAYSTSSLEIGVNDYTYLVNQPNTGLKEAGGGTGFDASDCRFFILDKLPRIITQNKAKKLGLRRIPDGQYHANWWV